MSAMSDYLENEILDLILGTGDFSLPSARQAGGVYLGLSVGSMAEDASGTELTINTDGYTRVLVAFDAASGGTPDNTSVIDFPACSGNAWGSIGFWSIWDAASGGNMLLHGSFAVAKTIQVSDVLRIAAGDLDVTAA